LRPYHPCKKYIIVAAAAAAVVVAAAVGAIAARIVIGIVVVIIVITVTTFNKQVHVQALRASSNGAGVYVRRVTRTARYDT
jgi:hypothetical protein